MILLRSKISGSSPRNKLKLWEMRKNIDLILGRCSFESQFWGPAAWGGTATSHLGAVVSFKSDICLVLSLVQAMPTDLLTLTTITMNTIKMINRQVLQFPYVHVSLFALHFFSHKSLFGFGVSGWVLQFLPHTFIFKLNPWTTSCKNHCPSPGEQKSGFLPDAWLW